MSTKNSFRDQWGTVIITSVIEMMTLPLIVGLIIGLSNHQDMGLMRCWWLAFSQKGVVFMLMATFITAVVLTIVTLFKTDYLKHDEKDRRISEIATYGDAHILTEEEIRAYFTVGDESHANRMCYGALDKENKEIVSEREFQQGEKRTNFNWALIASAGSGKTATVLKPMIISLALRGENAIISDTKGELYRDCERYLIKMGYRVFCYAPHKEYMDKSDSFNPMQFLGQDENKVLSFATFILELDQDATRQQFYENGELSLFCALCMLFTNPDFKKVKPDCDNITYMYKYLTTTDMGKIVSDLGTIKSDASGYEAACAYIGLDLKQKTDFKQGLQNKLVKYNSESVQHLIGKSDFEPLDFFGSKTILFLVVSDNDPTFMPLISCFFSFFINSLIELSDKVRADKARGIKQGCIFPAFNIILEETNNIGKIQNLNRVISTVRGRNMNTVLTFQNMQQMATTYKGEEHSLLSACHTQLYFGVNDMFTAEYVSKLMGEKTVEVEGSSKNSNGSQQRYQDARTLVMQPSEIMEKTFSKTIVKIAGKQPMLLWPITFMNNPKYADLYTTQPDSTMNERLRLSLRNDKYYEMYNLPKPDEEVRLQRKREIRDFLKCKDLIQYYQDKLGTEIAEKDTVIVATEEPEDKKQNEDVKVIGVAKPKTHRRKVDETKPEQNEKGDNSKSDQDAKKGNSRKKTGKSSSISIVTEPAESQPKPKPKPKDKDEVKKEPEPYDIFDVLEDSEPPNEKPITEAERPPESNDVPTEIHDESSKEQEQETVQNVIEESLEAYLSNYDEGE